MEKILKSVLFTNLKKHKLYLKDEDVLSLFKADDTRTQSFSIKTDDVLFDFSHHVFEQKANDATSKIIINQNIAKSFQNYFELEDDFSYHFLYRSIREDKYKYNGKFTYGEVEKFFATIDKIDAKIENKEINGIFFTDFIIILSQDNKDLIAPQFDALLDFKRKGRNFFFASSQADLEQILNKAFVGNTFFIFADADLKDDFFQNTYDFLSAFEKENFDIQTQSAFVCQNIKFAQKINEKCENCVSYSSNTLSAFDYFPLMLLPLQLMITKQNLNDFLSGYRDIDLSVKNDIISSIPYNLSVIYLWYILFDETSFNIRTYDKNMYNFSNFVNTLSNILLYQKDENILNFYQTDTQNKRNFSSSKAPHIFDIIYFKNEDNSEFLSDLTNLHTNGEMFNTLMFKENNLKNLGQIFGIYEYLILILKFTLFGNLKIHQFLWDDNISKNKTVANAYIFLEDK